jgi:hypothetical protein
MKEKIATKDIMLYWTVIRSIPGPCQPGHHMSTEHCVPCPENTYQPMLGSVTCHKCPGDSRSPPASADVFACKGEELWELFKDRIRGDFKEISVARFAVFCWLRWNDQKIKSHVISRLGVLATLTFFVLCCPRDVIERGTQGILPLVYPICAIRSYIPS